MTVLLLDFRIALHVDLFQGRDCRTTRLQSILSRVSAFALSIPTLPSRANLLLLVISRPTLLTKVSHGITVDCCGLRFQRHCGSVRSLLKIHREATWTNQMMRKAVLDGDIKTPLFPVFQGRCLHGHGYEESL